MERTKTISTTGELVMELGADTVTALFFSSQGGTFLLYSTFIFLGFQGILKLGQF